jgi:hypothetical protein
VHHVRPANVNAKLESAGCSDFPAFFDDASLLNLKSSELFRDRSIGCLPSNAAWRCVRV